MEHVHNYLIILPSLQLRILFKYYLFPSLRNIVLRVVRVLLDFFNVYKSKEGGGVYMVHLSINNVTYIVFTFPRLETMEVIQFLNFPPEEYV